MICRFFAPALRARAERSGARNRNRSQHHPGSRRFCRHTSDRIRSKQCVIIRAGRGNEASYQKGHEDHERNQSTKHFIPSFSLLTLKYINSPFH